MLNTYEIDPYGDTEFDAEQVSRIISICRSIKANGILDNYDKGENSKEMFESLEKHLFALDDIKEVLENMPDGKEKEKLQKVADNLQQTLED